MAYIWINPVTESMYEPEVLDKFLRQLGYKRIVIANDWLSVVKEKYRIAVEQAKLPVMDVRCPKIGELLDELNITSKAVIPEIKPILIHCGQESSSRRDLQGEEKIITTPCQSLADMGNALRLQDTKFIPWNQFLESVGGGLEGEFPKKSPIPPGFFGELDIKTNSVSGEEEIRNYFEKDIPEDVQLVEMLFCKDGCHNGDGIRKCGQ